MTYGPIRRTVAVIALVIVARVAWAAGWYESCAHLRHHLHQRIRYFLLSNTMSLYYMNRIDIGIYWSECKQLNLFFLYHPTCCPWQGSGIMLLVSLSMGIEMSIARIIWVSGCVSIATLLHSGRMTIASSISSVVGNSIDVTLRRGATILGMGRDTVMVDDSGSGGGGITVVVGSCVVTDVVASCCWEARVASTRSNWGVIAGR